MNLNTFLCGKKSHRWKEAAVIPLLAIERLYQLKITHVLNCIHLEILAQLFTVCFWRCGCCCHAQFKRPNCHQPTNSTVIKYKIQQCGYQPFFVVLRMVWPVFVFFHFYVSISNSLISISIFCSSWCVFLKICIENVRSVYNTFSLSFIE